jgi:predicted nucleic acid-binding protein
MHWSVLPCGQDHLQKGDALLATLLEEDRVVTHPFVIGELSCGNIQKRKATLSLLKNLPTVPAANHRDVFELIEQRSLFGLGLGWTDAHLLTSSILHDYPLWTRDKALRKIAVQFQNAYLIQAPKTPTKCSRM